MKTMRPNGCIHYLGTNSKFLKLRNAVINDERLSFKALGLLSWLLSRPKNWDYTVQGISACRKEGKDAIVSALQEISNCGYLNIIYGRTQGRYSVIYEIYDHLSYEVVSEVEVENHEPTQTPTSHHGGFSATVNPQEYKNIKEEDNPIHTSHNLHNSPLSSSLPNPNSSSDPGMDWHGKDSSFTFDSDSSEAETADSAQNPNSENQFLLDPKSKDAETNTDDVFLTLVELSLNRNFSIGYVEERKSYTTMVAHGYRPQKILAAYKSYIQRYREEHPATTRFAMRLKNYLSARGGGLIFDAGLPADKSIVFDSGQPGQTGQTKGERYYDLADHNEQFAEYHSRLVSLWIKKAKLQVCPDNECSIPELDIEIKQLERYVDDLYVSITNNSPVSQAQVFSSQRHLRLEDTVVPLSPSSAQQEECRVS